VLLALNFKCSFCNCICLSGTLLSVNADCTLICHGHYAALKSICCKMLVSQWNVITRNLDIELAILVHMMA